MWPGNFSEAEWQTYSTSALNNPASASRTVTLQAGFYLVPTINFYNGGQTHEELWMILHVIDRFHGGKTYNLHSWNLFEGHSCISVSAPAEPLPSSTGTGRFAYFKIAGFTNVTDDRLARCFGDAAATYSNMGINPPMLDFCVTVLRIAGLDPNRAEQVRVVANYRKAHWFGILCENRFSYRTRVESI
jgi:hypothetical protein